MTGTKNPTVYILASQPRGTLYIGVTANLPLRLEQHKQEQSHFTSRYEVKHLVYAESLPNMETAILREKQLKAWHRQQKIRLIEKSNPYWQEILPY